MPDARTIARLLVAGAATLWATPALAQDCTPSLAVSNAPGGITQLHASLPCAPYARVAIQYGPLVIGEELSAGGTLTIDLPAMPGPDRVTLEAEGTRLTAALPTPTIGSPRFVAVIWPDGMPWAALVSRGAGSGPARRLGFPGAGPPTDVLALAAASSAALDIAVTPETCGRTLTATLVTSSFPTAAPIALQMPACHAVGQRLSLSLPS